MQQDNSSPGAATAGGRRPADAATPDLNQVVWQAVVEALPGYLCIADPDRRIRYLNRPTLGRDLRRFVGRDFAEFVAAEQRPLVADAVARVLAGAAAVELETRGAESERWFRARIAGIREQGVITGLVVHVQDVDDAKSVALERDMLRARLRQAATNATAAAGDAETAQRRLDLMADALPVLISYVDAAHRYQYNNAAYTRWFGTSQDAMRGRTLHDVMGTAAYEQVRIYADAALAGRSVTFEMTIPYKAAGLRRVIAHYVPDVTAAGEIAGFYALIEDVTAQRKAEDALRQREDELRHLQKMEALGRLAGGIAHEFNNLMQTIVTGCAGVLLSLPDEESPEAQQIARMKRTAERGASLTRQLLTFSRSEELRTTPLDLDALLADMEMLLERLLEANIELEFDRRCGCSIMADAGQIQQVMMNLLINARDAMPDGGKLRIETREVEVGPEEAARHATLGVGPYAVVTVSDNGTGMDEETLARIFDPFFTTKPPERGSGLGLSTVYGIVQGLSGFIEVHSAPGQGTTFRLYFPCAETGAAGAR